METGKTVPENLRTDESRIELKTWKYYGFGNKRKLSPTRSVLKNL